MSVLPLVWRAAGAVPRRARACLRQTLMVILINIPTMSFGLAMGWVSLASGEGAQQGELVPAAAALTFCASLVGVPLTARALAAGRKPALIATSTMFVACWALKLCGGGWWVAGARVCAGLGGAGAWTLGPLLAKEMCSERVRGAAVAALVLANNAGVLLMYIAADLHLPHRSVLWSCLSLSVVHCGLLALVPESPHYLAANSQPQRALTSLAWLRGTRPDEPALAAELAAWDLAAAADEQPRSSIKLVKDMLSDAGRRRAFMLCCVMVVGQEACGVLALLQFAEHVFVLARGPAGDVGAAPPAGELGQPARHALWLGVAQLVASALALYLVERVGRKRLMVWGGAATGAALALGAGAVRRGAGARWAAAALAAAVFADSAGLQPAPYALLADAFDYRWSGCAVSLVSALTWAGNALEVALFGALVPAAGLWAALALAAALVLALALFAHVCVPETRALSADQIYALLRGAGPAHCRSVVTKV